jgi:long-chain acyl-CoA synthetase
MPSFVNWSYPLRNALITDAGKDVTYGQLQSDVYSQLHLFKSGELVFIVGKNDVATVQVYLTAIEAGAVPLLLGKDISSKNLNSYITLYNPSKIFINKNMVSFSDGYKLSIEFDDYFLYSKKNGAGADLNSGLALLLATSGSTGSPKLVRFSLKNIISNADSIVEYLSIDRNERAITTLPFNYSYGMSVLNSHLRAGASIVLTERTFFDPSFWHSVKNYGVTSMAGVPFNYEMLLKLRFERMDLPQLRTLTQAGGKMAVTQTQRIVEICKAKGVRFYTMYGQTEASPRMAFLSPDFIEAKIGSIGRAIPGGRLWLKDEQGAVISSHSQIGELVYSGPNVALGYAHNQEDLMRGDDWCGILHTGDLAREDEEGFFFIEGRKQRFIKIFGVRVSLDAVEAWFAEKEIFAAAHGSDDHLKISIEGLNKAQAELQGKALANAMQIHPSALTISIFQSLPRLSSGKVDYPCLNKTHEATS